MSSLPASGHTLVTVEGEILCFGGLADGASAATDAAANQRA